MNHTNLIFMKKSYYFIILLSSLLVFTACKKDDDNGPTAEELQIQKLTGTWSVGSEGSVSRDNTSSGEWADFTLTLGENTYSTTNTVPEVWPVQGVWSFAGNDVNQIAREDGVVINVEVSETELTLSFNIPDEITSSRVQGITGDYIFVLTK